MKGLKNTFELLKQSYQVLMHDKELTLLLVFPAVKALIIVGVVGSIIYFTNMYEDENLPAAIAIGLVAVYIIAVIFVFYNVAIVAGALERLRGGDPTVGSSIRAARKRLGAIILWATIVFIVGLIISSLQNARNKDGSPNIINQIIGSILGAAWELLTFLVEPVLISENKGVFSSMKRSMQILKETWGAQVGLNFSVSILYFLVLLAGAGFGALFWLIHPVAGVVMGLVVSLPLILFIETLSSITKAVVYNYATGGEEALPKEVSKDSINKMYKTYSYKS